MNVKCKTLRVSSADYFSLGPVEAKPRGLEVSIDDPSWQTLQVRADHLEADCEWAMALDLVVLSSN